MLNTLLCTPAPKQDLLGLKKKSKEARDRVAAHPEPGQYFMPLGPTGPAFSFGNGWVPP
jgi:hypothetical protein